MCEQIRTVPEERPSGGRMRWGTAALGSGLLVTVVLLMMTTSSMGFSVGPTYARAPTAPAIVTPGSAGLVAAEVPSGAAHIGAAQASPNVVSTFAPRCFPITRSTCVRVCTDTTPNIIPTGVNHTSSVEPLYSQNIYLCVMSQKTLIWAPTGVPTSGPHSPITLNVTGVLWNGDPYMSVWDGTEYHAASATVWYTVDNTLSGQNATYPYVYDVTISNRSQASAGVQNFYPGETVKWWIQIINYTNTSGYRANTSVVFQYRVAGAWAFSPYPGAGQYAGLNASTGDLNIRWSPRVPNWNDTVNVSISVTAADDTNYSSIGMASLLIEEFRGTQLLANATHRGFPVGTYLNATGVLIKGAETSNTTIPARFAQVPGDTIVFWVVAQDNAAGQNDTIVLPAASYIVNGNGSFSSGVFSDDIAVSSGPAAVSSPVVNTTTLQVEPTILAPGQNVSLVVQSRSPAVSLFSALVIYTMSYPPLSEVATAILNLGRVNSTTFEGTIPGMPLNASVNFTILAFDYNHHLDESSPYSYSVPSLQTYVPVLPVNDTFFYVYVYNNGSASYVSGALVQIRGPTPAFNTVSSTRFGIAYPNATGNDFKPLLVVANASYTISVSSNVIASLTGGRPLTATVAGTNPMKVHATLAHGDDYIVVQEGNSIYFWINGTVASTVFSPAAGSGGGGVQLAGFFALAGTAVMAFVLYRWFDQIQKRRKAEERRVTL
ncbi:MAG TPA: hypothetical protein VGX00_03685 [Thermoplasmata archaeon]|nr:hypothetical protein [Thermoplasmata archaeon]